MLVVGGSCQTGRVQMTNRPRAGELLVADVGMGGGYFGQSVVLLLDCDGSGALGVVLNRIADADLDDVLPGWRELTSAPQVLFEGGPVSQNGAVCLAKLANPTEDPPGWRRIHDDLGLLHLDTPTEIARGAYADLRIFAGYAGWEAGQLEGELLRGDWHRVRRLDEDVFCLSTEGLWRRVLRRQGFDLALMSTWSEDPEAN